MPWLNQSKESLRIPGGYLVEDRLRNGLVAEQLPQVLQMRHPALGIAETDVGTEQQPVLKLDQEPDAVLRVTGERVIAAAGRYVPVQVRIAAKQFGQGPFF